MLKKIIHALFGAAQLAIEPPPSGNVVKNVPVLSDPILLFMESPAFVAGLSTVPSWQCIHARTFNEFMANLTVQKYSMLIALSPSDDSGAAGRAIHAFRSLNPDALTVYHGWDYRLSVSGPRALACKADVLIVGGIMHSNLICCLGTALTIKRQVVLDPTQEIYNKLLEITCAESPFWKNQNTNLPISEIE